MSKEEASIPRGRKDDNAVAKYSMHSRQASALIIAATDKAGMDGIDRARIDEIILRESGNSSYMQQQRRRDDQVNQRIAVMMKKLNDKNSLGESASLWQQAIERELDAEVQGIIRDRPSRSTCVVVDLDMFYIACELLSREELRYKPCCVGSGMITTSNYVARKYGVRSAMAGFLGDKLVEELSNGKEKLIHLPHSPALYSKKSQQVRELLKEYDPNIRAYSLDEVYLDIGPYVNLRLRGHTHPIIVKALNEVPEVDEETMGIPGCQQFGIRSASGEGLLFFSPQAVEEATTLVVEQMRQRVVEVTEGLTCSAGIASNFMLAKIASDRNKPNGQLHVGPSHEQVLAFLHPLSTRKVGGIGRVTEKMLAALDITTVQDLFDKRAVVRYCFKPATAAFLLRASLGGSSHDFNEKENNEAGQKGISRERTFPSGRPWNEIHGKLEEITRKLSHDMISRSLWGHTITLKVKLHTFDVVSRARTLPRGVYTQRAEDMVKVTVQLLKEVRQQVQGVFSIRLLGVRCSNFQSEKERSEADKMDIKSFFLTKKAPIDAHETAATIKYNHRNESTEDRSVAQEPPKGSEEEVEHVTQELKKGSKDQVEQVSCPICGVMVDSSCNNALNSHIDSCLNGPTVRQVVKEQDASSATGKRKRLTDFFGC